MQVQQNTTIITLPGKESLFEKGSQAILASLTEIALKTQPGFSGNFNEYSCILLIQDGSSSDFSRSWFLELKNDLLLDELAFRLIKFHYLLFLIARSKIPWFYAADSDCLGSHAELALSCHKKYWFSASASLGFPEMESQVYPTWGTLDFLVNRKSGFVKDNWRGHPVTSARTAFLGGFIDFAATMKNWQGWMEAVCLQQINDRFQSDKSYLSRRSVDVTTDVFREFVNIDKKTMNYIYQDAQYFMGGAFLGWLERATLYQEQRVPVAMVPEETRDRQIYVNLDLSIPNITATWNLLAAGNTLVFFAADADTLTKSLELIWTRLERLFPAKSVDAYWKRQVFWFMGEGFDQSKMLLKWQRDDSVIIKFQKEEIVAYQIKIEDDESLCFGEMILPDIYEKIPQIYLPILRSIFHAAIQTRPCNVKNGGVFLPLHVFLRSIILDELIRIFKGFSAKDFQEILDNLKKQGWGFTGNEFAWDRFLRTRQAAYTLEQGRQKIGLCQIKEESWNLNSWARLLETIEGSRGEKASCPDPGRHLALYLGVLADIFYRFKQFDCLMEANLFVSEAAGLPVDYGSVLSFPEQFGKWKAVRYIEEHWPEIQ